MELKPNGTLQLNSLVDTAKGLVTANTNGGLERITFNGDSNKVFTQDGHFHTISYVSGWKQTANGNLHNSNSGFVGIGTSSPQYLLDVNGSAHFNGTVNAMGLNITNKLQADTLKGVTMINVNNSLSMTGGTVNDIYSTVGDLRLQSNVAFHGNTLLNVGTTGNVGVGIFSPQYKFDVNGDARFSGKIYSYRIVPLPGDSEIHFGDSSIIFSPAVNRISCSPNGNFLGMALGFQATAFASHSISIGDDVTVGSAGINSIVIGQGFGFHYLINTIPNSLMVGFKSNIPTLFVGPGNGINTYGKVGIGTTNPLGDFQVGDGTNVKFCIRSDGRIEIGSARIIQGGTYDDAFTRMTVDGRIMCQDVVVSTTADWPDYVFDSTYVLLPLDTVADYLKTNKHLPGSIPASAIQQNGFSVSETVTAQQKQIEEMMLYMIELQKQNEAMQEQNAAMQKEIDELKKK